MKKEDKRVIKTTETIKETFIGLVEMKGYSNVTVKDITTRANINRNTFYLHYKDKEDLIDKIVMDVITKQRQKINEFANMSNSLKNEIISFLNIIYEEIEFYRVLLNDPNLVGYFSRLKSSISEFYYKYTFDNTPESKVFTDFAINGFFGVLEQWIVKDSYSIEEIANALNDLIKMPNK